MEGQTMIHRRQFVNIFAFFTAFLIDLLSPQAKMIFDYLIFKASPEGMSLVALAKKGKKKKKKKKCSKKKRRQGKCGNKPPPTPIPPPNGIRRKLITEWSAEEKAVLLSALKKMNEDGLEYFRFVERHHLNMNVIHGGPVFLPWHNGSIEEFEERLRFYEPSFDRLPLVLFHLQEHRNLVFRSDFLGIEQFGNWRVWVLNNQTGSLQEREPRGLRRQLSSGGWPTLGQIQTVLSFGTYDQPGYDRSASGFRNAVEGWLNGPAMHNLLHINVGGDATVSTSPNDPVFWLIHVFVDYLWWVWKRNRSASFAGLNPDAAMPQLVFSSNQTPRQREQKLLGTTYPDNLISFPRSASENQNEGDKKRKKRKGNGKKRGQGKNHSGGHNHMDGPTRTLQIANVGFLPDVMDMEDGVMSMNFPYEIFSSDEELEARAKKAAKDKLFILASEDPDNVFSIPMDNMAA